MELKIKKNHSERGNTGIFPNIPLHGFFFMDGCNIKIIEHNMQVRIIYVSNSLYDTIQHVEKMWLAASVLIAANQLHNGNLLKVELNLSQISKLSE